MDINAAYRDVVLSGAAKLCGTTPKTVRPAVAAADAAATGPAPAVAHNYDTVADIVAERVAKTNGLISAKRLLPRARAAGYSGSARNFRRLVSKAKKAWRLDHHRGRRPGVWAPGDMVVIDWDQIGSLSVFCAVQGWSRVRFVYLADQPALRVPNQYGAQHPPGWRGVEVRSLSNLSSGPSRIRRGHGGLPGMSVIGNTHSPGPLRTGRHGGGPSPSAHNSKVAGSNPAPATKKQQVRAGAKSTGLSAFLAVSNTGVNPSRDCETPTAPRRP